MQISDLGKYWDFWSRQFLHMIIVPPIAYESLLYIFILHFCLLPDFPFYCLYNCMDL